jgi:hypothetical protein
VADQSGRTFSKSGQPISLEAGDSLTITVSDNLADLDTLTIMVQGTA